MIGRADDDVGKAIDAMGGTGAVARALGVGSSTVSNWRSAGYIPPRWAISLRRHARQRFTGLHLGDDLFRELPRDYRALPPRQAAR